MPSVAWPATAQRSTPRHKQRLPKSLQLGTCALDNCCMTRSTDARVMPDSAEQLCKAALRQLLSPGLCQGGSEDPCMDQ